MHTKNCHKRHYYKINLFTIFVLNQIQFNETIIYPKRLNV